MIQTVCRSSSYAEPIDDATIIDVDWEEPAPLATRAHDRTEYQEQKRQLNNEKIVRMAAETCDSDSQVSTDPVDEDWTAWFFNVAQDISSEDLQKL